MARHHRNGLAIDNAGMSLFSAGEHSCVEISAKAARRIIAHDAREARMKSSLALAAALLHSMLHQAHEAVETIALYYVIRR